MSRSHFLRPLCLVVFFAAVSFGAQPTIGWKDRSNILKRIHAPVFPKRDFSVTSYGAINNGTSDCTEAFARAIDACVASGGGRVVVPEGVFLTGAIHLRSNVNLFVSKGATIKFSTDPAKYLPVVFTRWEGIECMNYSALIYAYEQTNIAVTGEGVLDGQGANENWWKWCGKKEYGWGKDDVSQKEDKTMLIDFGAKGTPVSKRVFGSGHYLRPNFIQPYKCTNVLIEGVTLKDSPMWFLHPVLSKNVIVDHVTINGLGPNNDGCDPESCEDVLIKNTFFNTGDDCIAIKSGRNADGRRVNRPTKNVVITGCKMLDGHGGVVIGSEVSGGVMNVFADNCDMDSPKLDRALRFKTNSVRGGVLENFFARNIRVGQVKEAALIVDFQYDEGDAGTFTPTLRNISIDSLTCAKGEYAILIHAYKRSPVTNLTLTNCTFTNIDKPNVMEHVKNVRLKNVWLNGANISDGVRSRVSAEPAASSDRWSVRLAENFLRLHPDSIAYTKEGRNAKWNYEQGLMLEAFYRMWRATRDPRYFEYIRTNDDRYVKEDGSIASYEFTEYNLDNIAPGRPLFYLLEATKQDKYRIALDTLRKQLAEHPRTSDGGFWHKLIYPHQMWLDGLYMAEPFYVQYAVRFNEKKAFDDVARQFLTASRHMRDTATGLYYHAWDESRTQKWANSVTGCSPNFWGRSIGWYLMGLVDVLEYFPAHHPRRNELVSTFRSLVEATARYRDEKTGLWFQVIDQPRRPGNYREASVSAMLTYVYARGANTGLLEKAYRNLAQESFNGIVANLVTTDADGTINLNHVCSVAGLGGKPYRDGSFDYYVNEPQRTNDFKGYGPFLLAAIELERTRAK
ncbi:MAG TPA: glycoside hydrolase family 88 protein [Bacteroidota bacterium]|nr:glycoside hydrolase family 88 protein [Bacteroidota bacterium]